MRCVVALIVAALLLPAPAVAQEVCIPEAKARKCAMLIEAGRAGLLENLRECEARLNQRSGALDELREQYRREKQQTDRLSAKVGSLADERNRLRRRPKRWVVYVVSAGALLVGAGAGYAAGRLLP